MKTFFKSANRWLLLLATGVMFLGVSPANVSAQVINGPLYGAWPYAYWPYGQNGSTAWESQLRGQAAVRRAQGQQALENAKARKINEEARSKMLDNHVKYLQQRLTRKRLGTAERNEEFAERQAQREVQMALSDAEKILHHSESSRLEDETRAEAKLRIAQHLLDKKHEHAQTAETPETLAHFKE